MKSLELKMNKYRRVCGEYVSNIGECVKRCLMMGEQTLVLSNMGDRVESVFSILKNMIRKKKKKSSNIGEYNYVQKILMM